MNAKRARQAVIRAHMDGATSDACRLAEEYLRKIPDDKPIAQVYGNALMELQRFDDAVRHFAQFLKKNLRDTDIATDLGRALYRQGKPNDAKYILEHVIKTDPKNVVARINLAAVYVFLREPRLALDVARQAVSLDPKSANARVNLGTAHGQLGDREAATEAYERAYLLDPTSPEALFCLRASSGEASAAALERILDELPAEASELRSVAEASLGMSLLNTLGDDLTRGWSLLEGRLSPLNLAYNHMAPVNPTGPRWDGTSSISGKRLLVWPEQGVGDVMLFATTLSDLASTGARVILEVDIRLVAPLARSFPDFSVISSMRASSDKDQYDFQIPIGSLLPVFRPTRASFSRNKPFIAVDAVKRHKFLDRLQTHRAKTLVGFCWRSGLLTPSREVFYTKVEDWAALVSEADFTFVNLQYGDCEDEIRVLEEATGRAILRWDDLDLKNDLDDVFALMSCLDFVVTVGTAVASMAGALGLRTILLATSGWDTLGSSERHPFSPNTRLTGYEPKPGEPINLAPELAKVPQLLRSASTWDR